MPHSFFPSGHDEQARALAGTHEIRERPILFSGPMVTAILAGVKTQTRRVVKGHALDWLEDAGFTPEFVASPENHLCPYGVPGDRLWVRETHHVDGELVRYAADRDAVDFFTVDKKWRPSIHMRREHSRITLDVVAVRIERLRAMSEADAIAEGCRDPASTDFSAGSICYASAVDEYELLWNSINGKRAHWGSDPWVWVVEFKRA